MYYTKYCEVNMCLMYYIVIGIFYYPKISKDL